MRSEVGPVIVCPWWLVRDKSVSAEALRFWCLLKGHYADNTCPNPSRAEIGADLGISVDSVDRWTRILEKAGAIRVTPRKIEGVAVPHEYELCEVKGGRYAAEIAAELKPSEKAISLIEGVPSRSRATTPKRERRSSTKVVRTVTLREQKYQRFNVWWSRYPKKVAAIRCKRIWLSLGVEQDEPLYHAILDGLHRWVRKWEATIPKGYANMIEEERYIPNPSTCLRERRWEDEVRIPTPKPEVSKHTQDIVEASAQFSARLLAPRIKAGV